jgi:GntR family transcriptional regulator/MocR family aminotransferase
MARTGSIGVFLPVVLDGASAATKHDQLAEALRSAVRNGRLHPGDRLPSTRLLADEWQVGRNTVVQVFEALTDEGLLESRVGAGTFIAKGRSALAGHPRLPDAAAEALTQLAPPPAPAYPFRGLSRRGRDLIAQSQQGLSERPVPFMPDIPDLRAFPMRSWLRLMNEVSGRLTGNMLVNVPNSGYEPLREAIATHLALTRDLACRPEDVIITTGSQQSLDLVSRLLLDRGDPVWLEEPCYTGARAALAANGTAPFLVAADAEGMDVARGIAQAPAPRLIIVSPSRHYPLGGRLSDQRRAALIAHAERCGSWILEDDYDGEFNYDRPAGPSLATQGKGARVIHIGTFSKTLLPSFRLGYIVAPPDIAPALVKARAVIDRHAPIFEQLVLSEFMHRGLYGAHLRRMRALYRERQSSLVAVLEEAFGYRPAPHELDSGMHLVVPLKAGTDDIAVVRDLWTHGTVARPLSIYYGGKEKRSGLILGFAAFSPDEIRDARLDRHKNLRGLIELADGGPAG